MARRGGFGASLNPLGTGTFSNFSQYDVGDDLADLKRYEAEVAWSNGQLSNADYLAALREALAATSEGSRSRISAQNKLDDATYRIGRADAQIAGPDALIAYDTAALATMRPDNPRYGDVKQSLDSQLAQRRSRDYGALVDVFNAGKMTVAQLSAWVKGTLATLSPDAPDFGSWSQTADELTRRVQSEADSTAYQDYQQGRMKPDAFLGYLNTRRDGYLPGSPQYADWTRRVEDATKQVRDAKLAAADSVFFNAYNAGKKSDKDYLRYLRTRITGMDPDDPSRAEWESRYVTGARSLAEDQLRFDVEHGKKPIGSLIAFYEAYRRTLNPGSAEWRTTTERLENARKWKPAGSGGGTAKGSGYNKYDPTKAVSPKDSLHTLLGQLTVTSTSSKAMVGVFELNKARVTNAWQRGDRQWLYVDPVNPRAVRVESTDANGKKHYEYGTFLVNTTDAAYTGLLGIKADYEQDVADAALAEGKISTYNIHSRYATEALDALRGADIHAAVRRWEKDFEDAQNRAEHFKVQGDKAGFLNAVADATILYDAIMSDTLLDESKRNSVTNRYDQLTDDPLVPLKDPLTGKPLPGAVDMGRSMKDGQGYYTDVVLSPGWHDEFKVSRTTGERTIGTSYQPVPGVWEADHVTVSTRFGERVLTADAEKVDGPFSGQIIVRTDGEAKSYRWDVGAKVITWFDDEGEHVAHSIDDRAWITSDTGRPPTAELNVELSAGKPQKNGSVEWFVDGNRVLTTYPDGSAEVEKPSAGSVGWYGQAAVERRLRWARNPALRGEVTMAQREPGGLIGDASRGVDVGDVGQRMTLAFVGEGGLNLLPTRVRNDVPRLAFYGSQGSPIATLGKAAKIPGPTGLASPRFAGERTDAIREAAGNPFLLAQLNAQLPPKVGQTFIGVGLGYTPVPPAKLPTYSPYVGFAYTSPKVVVKTTFPTLPKGTGLPPPPLSGKAADDLLPPPKPKPPTLGTKLAPGVS